MSRPPATSRKVGRVVVLLVLFLLCLRAKQTARALLGPGAVPLPRSVPPGIWARNLLVARRAEADGTLDGGEAEDHEDVKGSREDDNETKAPKGKDDVEEAKASFDEAGSVKAEDKTVDEAASAQTADPVEDAKQDLDAAKRQRDVALRGLERAEALAAYLQDQLLGLKDSSSEKAKEVEAKLEKAEEKVEKAERKVETAKQEVEKVKEAAKEAAKASVQAGRVQDLLAIPDSTGHSASDLLAIKDRLQQQLSRNLHAEPNDADYVNHEDTSKAFLSEVSTMLEHFKTSRRLNKADSPLLEYATMSGAGKTRWGFHVERLLKAELPDCAILRVGLNFNGGSGGGDADRTEAVHLLSTQNFSDQQTMACLLFARGLLQCSPDAVRHFAAWLRGLTTPDVLDALFESAPEADTRILVVHLDELAMLLKETRLGFTDKNLKEFVNNLADYNCGQRPLGLVVPVITHTSPVIWDPETTTIPLKRMNLGPFSFAESLKFFQGINVTDLDSLLAISACGGHAALLVEMRKFMGRKSGGLGPLITCSRLDLHRKSVKAMGMSKQECISLLKAILLQQVVLEDKIRRYSQKGLLFLEDDDGRYRVSVPYPCLLNLLEVLDRPGRFENLRWTGNTPAKSRWRTKAFEALCAIRIAIEMKDFPYDSPRDPNTVATTFVREKKSCVCLAKNQNEAGVDAIGVDGGTMILLQCKYPEMDSTAQDWKEVEQFMNFTAKTGVEWAKKAGCNQIRAIFATGRAPRNYTSTRPTELEVDGVHISYTVYAKTENRKDCAIRAMPISTWIPSSVMCF